MARISASEQHTPADEILPAQPETAKCPHCGSTETELLSHFGSMLMSAQHYCHTCHTVFDQVRWDRP